MDAFTPLFSKLVDSSAWDLPDAVRIVWVTMLACKDRDHVVRHTAYALARKARKTEAEVIEALKVLAAPDTTRLEPQPYDGRRIQRVEDGWLMLNAEKYQALMFTVMRRAKNADAMRRRRAAGAGGPAPVTPGQKLYEADLNEHGGEHAAINASGDRGTPPAGTGIALERDWVLEILEYLNAATGRVYRPVDTNLKLIRARLQEDGVTFEGMKQMIDRQVLRWKGTDMAEYLRPETLFGKTKFQGYYAAKDEPIHEGARVQNAGRYNPNAGLAGAEADPYGDLGRTIGAGGVGTAGDFGPGAEPPAEPGGTGGASADGAPARTGAPSVPSEPVGQNPVPDEPPPE